MSNDFTIVKLTKLSLFKLIFGNKNCLCWKKLNVSFNNFYGIQKF